jgi:hypothetical protein
MLASDFKIKIHDSGFQTHRPSHGKDDRVALKHAVKAHELKNTPAVPRFFTNNILPDLKHTGF